MCRPRRRRRWIRRRRRMVRGTINISRRCRGALFAFPPTPRPSDRAANGYTTWSVGGRGTDGVLPNVLTRADGDRGVITAQRAWATDFVFFFSLSLSFLLFLSLWFPSFGRVSIFLSFLPAPQPCSCSRRGCRSLARTFFLFRGRHVFTTFAHTPEKRHNII